MRSRRSTGSSAGSLDGGLRGILEGAAEVGHTIIDHSFSTPFSARNMALRFALNAK